MYVVERKILKVEFDYWMLPSPFGVFKVDNFLFDFMQFQNTFLHSLVYLLQNKFRMAWLTQRIIASSAYLTNFTVGWFFEGHWSKVQCRNRLASNGLITPPCGVPFPCFSIKPPDFVSNGEQSYLLIYISSQFSGKCFSTASISLSCGILSKNPLMSKSITQSYFQEFSRTGANAWWALLPILFNSNRNLD
jgi:hypothetical protein